MKALFIGLGGVGQRHLRNLLKIHPDIQIGALRHSGRTFEIGYDLKPDYSVDIMKKYNILHFSSMESAIDWQPDFAIISSPTSLHVKHAESLVQAGIHVFIEKPVSHSMEGVSELAALAKEKGVYVMVGYMFRFHPGVEQFLSLVKNRVLGPILSAHIRLHSFMPAWHSYEAYNEFYAGKKNLGGGAILSEIHEIDLLAEMLGMPKKIIAEGGNYSPFSMDVEDTVSALLVFNEDDRSLPVTLNLSFVQLPPARVITFYCGNGYMQWSGMDAILEIVDETQKHQKKVSFEWFERNDMFIAELKHFVDCIFTGKKLSSNLEDTLTGFKLAASIKESIHTKIRM